MSSCKEEFQKQLKIFFEKCMKLPNETNKEKIIREKCLEDRRYELLRIMPSLDHSKYICVSLFLLKKAIEFDSSKKKK